MSRWDRRLLRLAAIAALITLVSSALYVLQRGFGGGHGRFDRVLFILGLPWSAIPWPSLFADPDLVWLIAIPLAMNLTILAGLGIVIEIAGARRRDRG